MQTENLANNNHKQFYVLLNTNERKSFKKFLNSESTAYFLDEAFILHTYTTFLNDNF